jgi:hypothetical protein
MVCELTVKVANPFAARQAAAGVVRATSAA